jgi:uncharacterized repeat protein (TIGR02543 family)
MKKFRKLIKLLLIPLVSISLSSCSFVASEGEDALYIQSITTTTQDDGSTLVTITYTDTDQAPITFTIPKGETGNGIKEITSKKSDDGSYTLVTITFTDDSTPLTFQIPSGISITGYRTETDADTGNTKMYIEYSDGTESEAIVIPKGEKGEDGTSITNITSAVDDNGNSVVTITLSDGKTLSFTIPKGEKGDTGKGISSIKGEDLGNGTYQITFTYTDDTTSTINIPLPETAHWYSGVTAPNNDTNAAKALEGDYYLNTKEGKIYQLTNNGWVLIITFPTDTKESYSVTFKVGDDESWVNNGTTISGSEYSFTIDECKCFNSSGYSLPLASKSGYTFMGWYTTKTPNVTNGAFTDLTPVTGDLTLYSYYQAV